MRLRKVVLTVCILLSAVLFAGGLYVIAGSKVNSKVKQRNLNRISQEGLHDESSIFHEAPVNLLILGLDEYGERSDVILLMNYSPTPGKVNILSISRDTMVYVKSKPVKINSLIAIGGERLVADRIEKMTGLMVDYYVTIDFAGFRKVIDTLDGVEFDVPFNMNYDDPDQNLHIHLEKGRQMLDGKRAEQLVRYRKGNRKNEGYEDGDIGRIKMQQQFIESLIQQKLKLKYLSKADDIYFILKEHLSTNIEIGDVRYYLKYIKDFDYHNVRLFTIPGEAQIIDGLSYFIHDSKETKKMINEEFTR